MLTSAYILFSENLAVCPVIPGSVPCAAEVARAIAKFQPHAIALDLPAALSEHFARLAAFAPRIALLTWQPEPQKAAFLASDPASPWIEAQRRAAENSLPAYCIGGPLAWPPAMWPTLPDDQAATEIGLAAWATPCLETIPTSTPSDNDGAASLHQRLAIIAERHGRVLFVCQLASAAHLARLMRQAEIPLPTASPEATPAAVRIIPVLHDQVPLTICEMPGLVWMYEEARANNSAAASPYECLREILRRAAEQYRREYKTTISLTRWRALFQYGRNLAVAQGALRPGLWEFVEAAKGCIDDDFAAICLEFATHYPPNFERQSRRETEAGARHSSLRLHTEIDGATVPLHHALPFPQQAEIQFRFRRKRPSQAERRRWRESFAFDLFSGNSICSWQPEDKFIEDFFRLIRDRAMQQIGEGQTTSEEFTSSVLDGLDLRETMRRWHEKKLFVRRERTPPGKIGCVVIIWQDLPLDSPGIWQTCLYAENQNESDIAFFSSPMGQEMVGPGITRVDYYGILSVYPAPHIPNVWHMLEDAQWGTCARLLMAAAVILCDERFIAVVSNHPPDAELRTFARDNGKAFIHLPTQAFSRSHSNRARQAHILAGKQVRRWAGDHIPPI